MARLRFKLMVDVDIAHAIVNVCRGHDASLLHWVSTHQDRKDVLKVGGAGVRLRRSNLRASKTSKTIFGVASKTPTQKCIETWV